MATAIASILGGSIPDVGGLTEGLPSIPSIPPMPSIPNPSSLLGKLPTKPPGLNAALDKINVVQDELKEKMGDLKADLSANIGEMKEAISPLADKLKESVSLSAGDIKIPTVELKKEMGSLFKQLGTGSPAAAKTFAGISTSFPSFDLLGVIKKASAPPGPMDIDATDDDGPAADVELYASLAAAGGSITDSLNVGRAEAGLPLFEPDDSGPAYPGEEEEKEEEGTWSNFDSEIPNQQIIDGEVVEKAEPTEAPDIDATEPDFPPENPIPAIAINSIGLAAVSSDLMGKLSGLIGSNPASQMLKAETTSIEMRKSIKNKFFGTVVKAPKIDLENLSNITGLKPAGTTWKSPGGSGGFLAAMEKESRKTKAIISRSMAAPGGGSLVGRMMKLAQDQDLKNSMKAQAKAWENVTGGFLDKDYSEDPNAAAKGISYEYPESVD